jgi:SAM-dependent methyltransferase
MMRLTGLANGAVPARLPPHSPYQPLRRISWRNWAGRHRPFQPDRPVADIVSPIWHDEKERDDAGEPGQLVRLLEIKSGRTVADIGAGSGYYVVRLSPIVGSKGRIIAEDIVAKYLQSLRKRMRNLGLRNVVISLGEPHDPKLPPRSVDIAILVHMYHEIEQPYAPLYISSPRSSLKRASALSRDSPQHQSTVPHQVFCVARSLPLAIVRSVSIDSSAAMPISRFLRHRP